MTATLQVQPRPTPAERDSEVIAVEVDERLAGLAAALDDWVTWRDGWLLELREGHDTGRRNNVEARLVLAQGEQTSSLAFRLEQLDSLDDTGEDLVLVFEEADGIARLARLTPLGVDVELFHVLTYT